MDEENSVTTSDVASSCLLVASVFSTLSNALGFLFHLFEWYFLVALAFSLFPLLLRITVNQALSLSVAQVTGALLMWVAYPAMVFPGRAPVWEILSERRANAALLLTLVLIISVLAFAAPFFPDQLGGSTRQASKPDPLNVRSMFEKMRK
jgi:hypothetical protein